MKHIQLFVTCPRGIQPYLSAEIRTLGLPVLSESTGGVQTGGGISDAMRLNLHLRTAHRVLMLLHECRGSTPDDLYRECHSLPWERYLLPDGYFSVTSSVDTPTIRDSRFANLKCKDAIADRMTKVFGRRPDSGPERDHTVVHLHWKENIIRIYIDTSGEPLSRRGYRKLPHAAPLQETLAAAIILATGWSGTGPFVNPMCGSGTLAIEAALIALKRPPGLLRDNFGFMHLKGFDQAAWRKIREEVRKGAGKSLPSRIIATDRDPKAVEAAMKNAETAGVAHLIDFSVCDFADTIIPQSGGVILMNPEYGERMGQERELEETYRRIGDFFKQKCAGYQGYVFTGNPALSKKIGLRTKQRIPFYNGPIECRLLKYDLYLGTRKLR